MSYLNASTNILASGSNDAAGIGSLLTASGDSESEAPTTKTSGPAEDEVSAATAQLFAGCGAQSTERRKRPPSTMGGYLSELPALIWLDRLPTPTLATALDGGLIYINPAFATMLGYPDTTMVTQQPLPALMAGHSATPPRDCVTALRTAGNMVINWLHAEGFSIATVISDALLVRATDPILLISITDINEATWNYQG